MNRRRNYRSKDRRAPEKTPLIDIIFLLLIFFFVNLSIKSESSGDKGGKVPSKRERELPRIAKINPITPGILIQVVDLSSASASLISKVNDLRSAFQNLSSRAHLTDGFAPPPPNGFMVLVDDNDSHNNIDAHINSLIERAWGLIELIISGGTPLTVINSRIRALFICYPACYPDLSMPGFQTLLGEAETDLGNMISTRLNEFSGLAESPKVHVRMPKTTYMWFLKSLYRILAERGLSGENVHIRALEELIL